MRRALFVILGLALVMGACGAPSEEVVETDVGAAEGEVGDELWEEATATFEALPATAESDANPMTTAKIELGRKLYFDTQLSKEGNISCNSCHNLATFGVDNLPFSPGDTGELGDRNSPTVLNVALHDTQFWDGRAADVEEQAGMPILNPVEMAIPDEAYLVDRLAGVAEYQDSFAAAFPGEEEPLSYANIGRALGAFERTLLTPSRWDEYLGGDREALTAAEKRGLQTFVDMGCTTCHNGVNLGANEFWKFGLSDDYWVHTQSAAVDEGRFEVTGEESDKFVFKVSGLRNVEKTAPYFHDGSVESLDEAVAIMAKVQLGQDLTPEQSADLAAFLVSLTGELPAEVTEGFEDEATGG